MSASICVLLECIASLQELKLLTEQHEQRFQQAQQAQQPQQQEVHGLQTDADQQSLQVIHATLLDQDNLPSPGLTVLPGTVTVPLANTAPLLGSGAVVHKASQTSGMFLAACKLSRRRPSSLPEDSTADLQPLSHLNGMQPYHAKRLACMYLMPCLPSLMDIPRSERMHQRRSCNAAFYQEALTKHNPAG